MSSAWVFPGQGSQSTGMGQELAENFKEAAHVFEEINDALGEKLTDIMWGEDEDALTLTQNAQPAIMAVSLATIAVLEKQFGFKMEDIPAVAGHSLGEYSALAAVKSMTIADTAKLLRLRGQSMQAAVPVGTGAMAAILGGDIELIEKIAVNASEDQVCDVANDNADGQIVISGHKQAVERAMELAKEEGIKRAVLLPVSAPFHCQLMQPAQEVMQKALSETNISIPIAPIYANVIADKISDVDEIRARLVEQVTGRVRWRESIKKMHSDGLTGLVEVGHGKVLSGMVRRIEKEMSATPLNSIKAIEEFAAQNA